MLLDKDVYGQGIYSPRQAARLVGTRPDEVVRWTRGSGPTEPLWKAYYQELDDSRELNFADLIELRVVKAFRNAGVSLQSIRFAITFAKQELGLNRPFSSMTFKTDGKEILVEAAEKGGDLVSLSKFRAGQKVFTKIVEQSLRDLEYDDGTAARWRPADSKEIVIDPARQFGSPIIDSYGISSSVVFSDFKNYHDVNYLAQVYEIPKRHIKAALEFEKKLDATQHGKGTL